MEYDIEHLSRLLVEYGMKVAGGIAVLVVGYLLAGLLARRVRRVCERSKTIDDTLTPVLFKLTRIGVLLVTVVAVLNQFGVQTASLIALLGAAGLAIGLALQGALGNVASGVLLLTIRPIEIGDTVLIGGDLMTIDEISLLTTQAHTPDNIYTVLPNSSVWGGEIRNYSRNATRRIDLVIGIGYEDDIERALSAAREVLEQEPRVLDDPPPFLAVGELADSSVNLLVRPWVRSEDYFPTLTDLTRRIKERYDEAGISIPFPQRDLHIVGGSAPGS